MLDDPVGQSVLKPDIIACLLRLNPFVLHNLLALGLKFPIERRVFYQIMVAGHSALARRVSRPNCTTDKKMYHCR